MSVMGFLPQLVYVSGFGYYSLLEWIKGHYQFYFSMNVQKNLVHIKSRWEWKAFCYSSVNSLNSFWAPNPTLICHQKLFFMFYRFATLLGLLQFCWNLLTCTRMLYSVLTVICCVCTSTGFSHPLSVWCPGKHSLVRLGWVRGVLCFYDMEEGILGKGRICSSQVGSQADTLLNLS